MTRVAVFASGRGSNFSAILHRIESGDVKNAHIAAVISNNGSSGALELARKRGIPAFHVSSRTHPDPRDREEALLAILRSRRIGLILLAGYMKLLPRSVIQAYPRRILNIHPALLPRFGGKGMYGIRVHESVIRSGVRETGVTVHHVDERYDEGPIVAQIRVPVRPEDTPESLAARVLEVEHDFYWRAVDHLINGTPLS
jgi:phosphoribosylglycinamide formyltransferase-1